MLEVPHTDRSTWSEYYPRKAWKKAIELRAEDITRGGLAMQAAELFKKVVDVSPIKRVKKVLPTLP